MFVCVHFKFISEQKSFTIFGHMPLLQLFFEITINHFSMKTLHNLFLLLICISIACQSQKEENLAENASEYQNKGKLFIIGGGSRGESLVKRMIEESGVHEGGYGIILPMSSAEPDSAIFYSMIQFTNYGLNNVVGIDYSESNATEAGLDSIRNAKLIYIAGGDQNKFMASIKDKGIHEALLDAYKKGALIAGTSAGAAVQSDMMITGNERRYPDYSSTFRNIESENIEFAQGLGFLKESIIDQHFVKRSRHNRLFSAVIEHPEKMAIGIDEATAILVEGNMAEVVGESQVLVFTNPEKSRSSSGEKLGAKGIIVDIYLPGERFEIKL